MYFTKPFLVNFPNPTTIEVPSSSDQVYPPLIYLFIYFIFQRTEEEAIYHRLTRPCHHPFLEIQSLNAFRVKFLFPTFQYYIIFFFYLLNFFDMETKRNKGSGNVLGFILRQVVEEPKSFSSFRERLYHLQVGLHLSVNNITF
jgi:hypothetical protein